MNEEQIFSDEKEIPFEDRERVSLDELRAIRPISGESGLVGKVVVIREYELLIKDERSNEVPCTIRGPNTLYSFTCDIYKDGQLVKKDCYTHSSHPPYACFERVV